ncbi:MAG: DUF2946 family protein [Pseudomonadota bacterium]|nr:DUF2946 family protein [Pseudomonadota bacterium]
MRSLRRNPFAVWLGILAVLAQLVLPAAHAQSWAKRNGDPLLYAFCGQVSPALIQQLRAVSAPELLQDIERAHRASNSLSCDLCTAVHGGHLASAPAAQPPVLLVEHPPQRINAEPAFVPAQIAFAFQARGPPLSLV